jgi:ATP:corrinoid adenosyltransferase
VRLDNNDINITQKLKERNTMTEKETIRLAYELSLDDYEKKYFYAEDAEESYEAAKEAYDAAWQEEQSALADVNEWFLILEEAA